LSGLTKLAKEGDMNLDHIKEKLRKEHPGLPESVIDEIVEEKYRKLQEEEDEQ